MSQRPSVTSNLLINANFLFAKNQFGFLFLELRGADEEEQIAKLKCKTKIW